MAQPTGTVIDMTPTWSGLLPALLDARANIKRRLFAEECDGKADGWCSIHEAEWERDSDTVCRYDQVKWSGTRQGLFTELTNLDGEFAKMAKGADMAVAIQKAYQNAGSPRGGGPVGEPFLDNLAAILRGEQA